MSSANHGLVGSTTVGSIKKMSPDFGPAPSLESLLLLDGTAFVSSAYLTLLQRPVDPSGLENYLRQLRTGTPKAYVIVEIATSAEAQSKSLDLPGLRALVNDVTDRQAAAERGLLQRIRRAMLLDAVAPLQDRLSAIESRLEQFEAKLDGLAGSIDSSATITDDQVRDLSARLAQLDSSIDVLRGALRSVDTRIATADVRAGARTWEDDVLPTRSEFFYRQLLRAAAHRNENESS